MATLTSVYADQTIVLGPLATHAHPQAYDLCQEHVDSFTAPRGWEVVRLVRDFSTPPPSSADLDALAEAIRSAGNAPKRAHVDQSVFHGSLTHNVTVLEETPVSALEQRAHLSLVAPVDNQDD